MSTRRPAAGRRPLSLLLAPLLLAPFLLLSLPAGAWAQTGRVDGRVVDAENGEPLEDVTVQVAGTDLGVLSGADGSFEIPAVPAGEQTVRARLIGYEAAERTIRVQAGETTELRIRLSTKAVEVSEIRVLARRRYRVQRTSTGTRTPQPLLETARSVSVVSAPLLEEQNAETKKDLYRNVAGLNEFAFNNDFTLRGFRVSGDQAVLYNGLRGNPFGAFHLDPKLTNVQQIEVLKGPTGVLYGSLPPGGLMNIRTRRPSAEPVQRIEATAGSFDTYNVEGHFTGPIDDAGALLYRVDAEFEDAGSFRDNQTSSFANVSGQLSWRPDGRTTVRLEAGLLDENMNGRRERGIPFYQGEVFFTPIDFTSHEESDFFDNQVYYGELHFDRELGEDLAYDASVRYFDSEAHEEYHEPRGILPDTLDIDGDGDRSELLMARNFRVADRFREGFSANSNLVWEVTTGPIDHQWLAGVDVLIEENSVPRFQRALSTLLGGPVPTLEVFSPDYSPGLSDSYRLGAFVPTDAGVAFRLDSVRQFGSESTRLGGYLQNQLQVGERLHLSGAVRFDSYDDEELFQDASFSEDVFTFRGGGLFELTSDWSLYSSYSEGYQPQSVTSQAVTRGGPFPPEESWQVEVGSKVNTPDGRLSATVAGYTVQKENVLVTDPDDRDRLTALGEVESQGVEVEVAGDLTDFWSLTANYAYNDIEVTEDTDPSVVGTRPPNAPEHEGALWTVLAFRDGQLRVGGGPSYVGERATFFGPPELPSYITWEGMVSYRFDDFELRVNGENLANDRFITGGFGGRLGGMPGAPRNVSVTAEWVF